MTKYRARRTEVDGFTFASKKEANRYKELKLLELANEISELALQPRFQILPEFEYRGKVERPIFYAADFQYNEKGNDLPVVEEVKGYRTPIFNLKRKMFLKLYGKIYDYRIIT